MKIDFKGHFNELISELKPKNTIGFVPTAKSRDFNLTIFEPGRDGKTHFALIVFIFLMTFILNIPVTKTVKYPSFNITTENLSTTPYYQSYIEDIPNEPIPQFTELLERVGEFSGNVELVPFLGGLDYDVINGDWGIFNWAKQIVEFLIYPYVWIYNLWKSVFELILLLFF